MAVVSRRHKQKQRLEQKLAELKALMGDDMSNSMLERTATRLMAQEETLRDKQNRLTETCNENLDTIMKEMAYLCKLMLAHGMAFCDTYLSSVNGGGPCCYVERAIVHDCPARTYSRFRDIRPFCP